MSDAASLLSPWESFYLIVGPSGAVLVGLQFVVLTLLAADRRSQTTPETVSAFGTPTVVHFGAALAIAAVMSAPWPSLWGVTWTLLTSRVLRNRPVSETFWRGRVSNRVLAGESSPRPRYGEWKVNSL